MPRAKLSANSTSTPARPWSITSIWNWSALSRSTTRARWAWTIPVLCLSAWAQQVPPDYKSYFDAIDAQKTGRSLDTLERMERVFQTVPVSPLNGKAALLAARAYLALGQAKDAVAVLKKYPPPQPDGSALLGEALEAAGDRVSAAGEWQRIYYDWPLSEQADAAESALLRLSSALGDDFPPVMPETVFARAEKLRKGGQSARAKRELLAAAGSFGGADREVARVRAHTGDAAGLGALNVATPEAESERLYLLHAALRRNKQEARAEAVLRDLDKRFPESRWTMEALTSWGNHHLLRNDVAEYVPLYRACAERFVNEYCQWKLAWAAWINRKEDARTQMETYLARFPEGEKAAAALYFLGRYDETVARFPMSWYAVLARPKASRFPRLSVRPPLFTPTPTLKQRIARARQLEAANLHDWAEFELRFAASEQPFLAAMELAEVAAGRGAHDQALRYIKGVARGYLNLAFEEAPERFWKLAFPLPYRSEVEEYSRMRGLDPFFVAALIRQESEFNPRAVSAAKAYGLTQVLPSTGRQLSRRNGVHGFRPSMLFEPETNLKLGTAHLRDILNAHEGDLVFSLASYNAGKSRTDLWRTWYEYREPAEFVETIPFTETRTYVQVVLRNADVYRRLYGKTRLASGDN